MRLDRRLCAFGMDKKEKETILSHYGQIESMQYPRCHMGATTVGDYAIFAGGCEMGTVTSSTRSVSPYYFPGTIPTLSYYFYALDYVDAYTSSLVHITPEALNYPRYKLAATTVGNYAIFLGGYDDYGFMACDIEIYNTSLVRSYVSPAYGYGGDLAATTVGNYALFGGGNAGHYNEYLETNAVYAFTESLVQSSITNLSSPCRKLAATSVGDYAIFAGGIYNEIELVRTADAYNKNLVKSSVEDLVEPRYLLKAASTENYAIFSSGSCDIYNTASVAEVYSDSLVHLMLYMGTYQRTSYAAASLKGYALFCGGASQDCSDYSGGGDWQYESMFWWNETIETHAYDNHLLDCYVEGEEPFPHINCSATTIGNYLLIAGSHSLNMGEFVDVIEATTQIKEWTWNIYELQANEPTCTCYMWDRYTILADGIISDEYYIVAAINSEEGSTQYPDYGVKNAYFYTNKRLGEKPYGVTYYDSVTSTKKTDYPAFGIVDGYLYCREDVSFDNKYYGLNPIKYYKSMSLTSQSYSLASTYIGNYALFGGGSNSFGSTIDYVDAFFSSSLTKTSVQGLSQSRCDFSATSVGNYAIFGAGTDSDYSLYPTTDAYTSNLVHTVCEKGSFTTKGCDGGQAAATIGNYALFSGGCITSTFLEWRSDVYAYDKSLVCSNASYMQYGKSHHAGTSIGNYALFGGGQSGYSYTYDNVDAYSSTLVRSNPDSLSIPSYGLAATSVGNYALFGGGALYSTSGTYPVANNKVTAYNKSLVKTTIDILNIGGEGISATTVRGYAIFAGGYDERRGYISSSVTAYDENLVRSYPPDLSNAKYKLTATTIGSYALFGGGIGDTIYDTVDAYTLK